MCTRVRILGGCGPAPFTGGESGSDGDPVQHLVRLGEAPRLALRKERLTVEDDLEDAPGASNQLSLEPPRLPDLGRQTGGSG